jgi:hypothetical protein
MRWQNGVVRLEKNALDDQMPGCDPVRRTARPQNVARRSGQHFGTAHRHRHLPRAGGNAGKERIDCARDSNRPIARYREWRIPRAHVIAPEEKCACSDRPVDGGLGMDLDDEVTSADDPNLGTALVGTDVWRHRGWLEAKAKSDECDHDDQDGRDDSKDRVPLSTR